jgi:dienelactone hydrolase
VHDYAQNIAKSGFQALVIDSFSPRGWGSTFAKAMVCTGLVMQGYERAGDVLAVLWGVQQDASIDQNGLVLVGFSHGGWSIMDLMTVPLDRKGDVKISDPDPKLLEMIKGIYLVYGYMNFPARSQFYDWIHKPKVFATISSRDHLTPEFQAKSVIKRLENSGVPTQSMVLDATHAFDEEDSDGFVMSYDAEATQKSQDALISFASELLLKKDTLKTTP